MASLPLAGGTQVMEDLISFPTLRVLMFDVQCLSAIYGDMLSVSGSRGAYQMVLSLIVL